MDELEIYKILKAAGGDMMGLHPKGPAGYWFWCVQTLSSGPAKVDKIVAHAILDACAVEVLGKVRPDWTITTHDGYADVLDEQCERVSQSATIREAVATALQKAKEKEQNG